MSAESNLKPSSYRPVGGIYLPGIIIIILTSHYCCIDQSILLVWLTVSLHCSQFA